LICFGNNRHGDINKLLQRARPGPAPGSQFFPPPTGGSKWRSGGGTEHRGAHYRGFDGACQA